jgi:hypothetical protein
MILQPLETPPVTRLAAKKPRTHSGRRCPHPPQVRFRKPEPLRIVAIERNRHARFE